MLVEAFFVALFLQLYASGKVCFLSIFFLFCVLVLSDPCWQENQGNHQLADLRTNKTVLDFIAFGIEDESGNAGVHEDNILEHFI